MRDSLKLLALLLPLALAAVPAAAAPDCNYLRFNLCDGCTIAQTISVKTGSSCVIPMRYTFGVGSIRITRRATKGNAGTSSNTYAYKAAPGFKGSDSFAVEIDYRSRSGSMEKTKVEVNVTVY